MVNSPDGIKIMIIIEIIKFNPARQNGDFGRNFAYFLLIFCQFSPYGTPSSIFRPTCLICLFLPISFYFLPIFCLKWYPILVINSSMGPICCFSAHMLTLSFFCLYSAHFLPIFRLTFFPYSAGPVLPGRLP